MLPRAAAQTVGQLRACLSRAVLATPYPEGPTSVANLAALCRHHHRLKHLTGWAVEQIEPGVLDWTSPTGHRYRTDPPTAADPDPDRETDGVTRVA